ncbi:Hpt domain-containing protein [Rhodopseudomonas pseudopalustris]|uniref:Hpt domain-containing protein n=1 Tax=Rhodopseudomonas pseudopalustris TaxID=1513892 RepID=A0A1H8Q3S5_9BRAD|nr:Hpt domain-containing protein [Rhodopseudomonas pseudopalustris]SEO48423.1 Hpt domain-containing protein [Rhodopseudomonas pseudopalustris]
MARRRPEDIQVATYADHQVITQANPLRKALRRVDHAKTDDPVARAEQALAQLSAEFAGWMRVETDRLSAAYAALTRDGVSRDTQGEFFRAAHDIKGDAATFGYPAAAVAADSLCRIIEHAPALAEVPDELIANHVHAIQAIVREGAEPDKAELQRALNRRLRSVADDYLASVNRHRPEHLEAILSPSIVPAD